MKFKSFIIGIVGSIALGSSAMAADVVRVAPPVVAPVVVPAAPVAFDWSGAYVGVLGFPPAPMILGQVGFNFVRGNLLVGAAGAVGVGAFGGATVILGGQVRAGLLLGQRDRVLVYGEAIFQQAIGLGGGFGFGAGAEVKLTDRLSVFGGAGFGGGCCYFTTGINFAFGG